MNLIKYSFLICLIASSALACHSQQNKGDTIPQLDQMTEYPIYEKDGIIIKFHVLPKSSFADKHIIAFSVYNNTSSILQLQNAYIDISTTYPNFTAVRFIDKQGYIREMTHAYMKNKRGADYLNKLEGQEARTNHRKTKLINTGPVFLLFEHPVFISPKSSYVWYERLSNDLAGAIGPSQGNMPNFTMEASIKAFYSFGNQESKSVEEKIEITTDWEKFDKNDAEAFSELIDSAFAIFIPPAVNVRRTQVLGDSLILSFKPIEFYLEKINDPNVVTMARQSALLYLHDSKEIDFDVHTFYENKLKNNESYIVNDYIIYSDTTLFPELIGFMKRTKDRESWDKIMDEFLSFSEDSGLRNKFLIELKKLTHDRFDKILVNKNEFENIDHTEWAMGLKYMSEFEPVFIKEYLKDFKDIKTEYISNPYGKADKAIRHLKRKPFYRICDIVFEKTTELPDYELEKKYFAGYKERLLFEGDIRDYIKNISQNPPSDKQELTALKEKIWEIRDAIMSEYQ